MDYFRSHAAFPFRLEDLDNSDLFEFVIEAVVQSEEPSCHETIYFEQHVVGRFQSPMGLVFSKYNQFKELYKLAAKQYEFFFLCFSNRYCILYKNTNLFLVLF